MNKLRFHFNKGLDEYMTGEFLNMRGGGVDFGEGIIKTHPHLKLVNSFNDIAQKEKVIHDYIDRYYKKHGVAMKHKMAIVHDAWRKKEPSFIAITENFFSGFPFPCGKYIAYVSIINCNPRFLESKTFQFFYRKPLADAVHVITHELLHFIFFSFVEKMLKKEIKHLSEDQLWDLSEIFNIVVLKSQRYHHIINSKWVVPYPDHRRYIHQFEKVYKNSKNAKEFIERGIGIVSAGK